MSKDDMRRRGQEAAAQQAASANEYLQQQGLGQVRPYGLETQQRLLEQDCQQWYEQIVDAAHRAVGLSRLDDAGKCPDHDHVSGEAYIAMKARAERAERRVAELADQLQPKDDEIRRLKAENHDLMRKGARHGKR